MSDFHPGGLASKGTVPVDPEECFIRTEDIQLGRGPCSRPDHAGRMCQSMTGEKEEPE